MTSNRGAGFRAQPLEQDAVEMDAAGNAKEAAALEKLEPSPDDILRKLEADVNAQLEKSTLLAEQRKWTEAIEAAEKARTLERQFSKKKEEENPDAVNYDLTYCVHLNLAATHHRADMYSEALHHYNAILKNKMFPQSGRVRINIGNIYFLQKKYLLAIKMYRMAYDMLPYTQQKMRNKILKNIGHAFVLMGQYADAISSYEHVLEQRPTKDIGGQERKVPGQDFETAFNVLLCYLAMGDQEKMKRGFQQILQQQLSQREDDERYLNLHADEKVQLVLDVIKTDVIAKREARQKNGATKFIITAAKLIAPAIDTSFAAGYDWCIDCVRQSSYAYLGAELEITKAITYLKMKEFKNAIRALKQFEKDDTKMQSAAATNLSFLYFLESQYAQADKYADVAITADSYNPQALVNKGNCSFVNDDYEAALGYYQQALGVDQTCTEALYNQGLCHKRTGSFEIAVDCFHKCYTVLQNSAEVIYQIAHCYELLEDAEQALEWFMTLVSVVPTDPDALAHLGTLFDLDNDKSQAFQYHYEAFRYFPSDIRTVEWLGAYYIESQFPEKAISYFERAALVQPGEVKWRLMVASCHRRSGDYPAALKAYKQIHIAFPEDVECLKFLVRICTDLGMKEDLTEYAQLLRKAEKAKEAKESRDANGKGGRSRSGRKKSGRSKSGRKRGGGAEGEASGGADGAGGGGGMAPPPPGELPGMGVQPEPSFTEQSYADPMGAMPERPKTAAARKDLDDDDWGDDHDDLLPE